MKFDAIDMRWRLIADGGAEGRKPPGRSKEERSLAARGL